MNPAPRADSQSIALRTETPEDAPLLLKMYAGTRQEEMDAAGFPAALQGEFVKMQFMAQSRGYRAAFPQAEFAMILFDGQVVGRVVIDRAADEIRLVDIELLPDSRGRGIGTEMLRRLMREATEARKPLRLSVVKGEKAFTLYQRLGFQKTADTGDRFQMEWRSDSAKP